MKKNAGTKVVSEWKLIMKNHPTFARVLLAQQAILIEASQRGDKAVDFDMFQVLNSELPVIFANYWAERGLQDFGSKRISDQLSCILDSPDGDPAACFNINPEDSWLDVPSKWKAKPALTNFPLLAATPAPAKAPAKKQTTVKKTAVKKAVVATKKVVVKVTKHKAIKRK
jgi:hypothetical protein